MCVEKKGVPCLAQPRSHGTFNRHIYAICIEIHMLYVCYMYSIYIYMYSIHMSMDMHMLHRHMPYV